jgi:hypothetical protein
MKESNFDVSALVKQATESFVSEETKSEVIPAGTHNVVLEQIKVDHSFNDFDGSPKSREYEWKSPNPLLAVMFKDSKGRIIVKSLHFFGYEKYEDLKPEQKKSKDYSSSADGFALFDGDRIKSDANTTKAMRNIHRLFNVIGLPTGSTIDDLQAMVDEKTAECTIKVEQETSSNDNEVLNVTSIKKLM